MAPGSQTTPIPNQIDAPCCVFLCENDGCLIEDFADPQGHRRALVPASVLQGLIDRDRMRSFLAMVEAGGAAPGSEMRIDREDSAGSLLLQGARTPYGILVFAVLPATGHDTPRAMSRDEIVRRHDDAVAQCAALIKQEEDNSRVLSRTVHDLKNPISSIVGSCEYLTQYCEDLTEEHLEMIAGIQLSARMLLQLSGRLSQLCGLSGPVDADV